MHEIWTKNQLEIAS
uniref:Uncharacterized protein n=1 Tax=Arundo donax TaxID=35708 RepID=A0A0A8YLL3_ARUDO